MNASEVCTDALHAFGKCLFSAGIHFSTHVSTDISTDIHCQSEMFAVLTTLILLMYMNNFYRNIRNLTDVG
jgi:hypothetical protein